MSDVSVTAGDATARGSSTDASWPHVGQSDENAAECALVDWMIGEVGHGLTDRRGSRHSPPWEPGQSVRVGVLRPRYVRPDEDDEDSEEQDDSAKQPAGNEPLAIGFDFTTPSGEAVNLSLDVDLAIYQPSRPTHLEMEQHLRETQPTSGSARGGPSRIPVPIAWTRSDIQIRGVTVSIPRDGTHVGTEVEAQLNSVLEDAIRDHYRSAEAARPFAPHTIPVADLADPASLRDALDREEDSVWDPLASKPAAGIHLFAEPLPDGTTLVSVSLTNEATIGPGEFQDRSFYDCRIQATPVQPTTILRQKFRMAPDDYRYHSVAAVIGHGRNCVAVEEGKAIRSETLPRFVQQIVKPREDHVPELSWARFASDPVGPLLEIRDAMAGFASEWQEFIEQDPAMKDPGVREASSDELADFQREVERFAPGLSLIDPNHRDFDELLQRAFKLANEAFASAHADEAYDSWRLFQLAFIVSELPSLAVRTRPTDERLRAELDHADVLWFPTGGGKTESYLGLIAVAAFYDRLRGKSRGITAWLRFPLRMLSVQQLDRVLKVLVAADEIRRREIPEGAAFELGYLVGGGNTPNRLMYQTGWWPGMDHAESMDAEDLRRRRLIAGCPHCGDNDSVELAPDKVAYRLLHRCRKCDSALPIHITDDEVYRYQPTVIVSTIDKLSGYAHFGEFTSLTHGPAHECPDHGYYSFGNCLAGDACDRKGNDLAPVRGWHDPTPSLIVQDELHLVREELGSFSAHFEGLIAELQRSAGNGLPSKILAATATIEQYDDQLRQVYGRRPRRFPSPGYRRERSFYTEEIPDVRRMFLGVLPSGSGYGKVEVSARMQTVMAQTINDLQDDPDRARQIVTATTGVDLGDRDLENLLFNHEASLTYVNTRQHGVLIGDDLGKLSAGFEEHGNEPFRFETLTGDVPISELASVIAQLEDATLDQPRGERLRGLVGTSVVSHGVDLARLNLMVMCGMPPTVADYIQATSRAGRAYVGLIVAVFDNLQRRESSFFAHFESTHRFLERMVEPVPLNRYARHSVDRTLPAIVMALLWDMARDPRFSPPPEGIRTTRRFQQWWNAQAATLEPELRSRLARAYRTPVEGIADPTLEDQLSGRALERWENVEKPQMSAFDADNTRELFRERVMASLRDVDEPVDFSALPRANRIYEALV